MVHSTRLANKTELKYCVSQLILTTVDFAQNILVIILLYYSTSGKSYKTRAHLWIRMERVLVGIGGPNKEQRCTENK